MFNKSRVWVWTILFVSLVAFSLPHHHGENTSNNRHCATCQLHQSTACNTHTPTDTSPTLNSNERIEYKTEKPVAIQANNKSAPRAPPHHINFII
ncbi:MAG: hypothetical protein O3A01_08125 [bacterium]|nr:hypothetical protein [bacterium]